MLNAYEKAVVRRFAAGDNDVCEEVEVIYRSHLIRHVKEGRKSLEMEFLSEWFTVCPDIMLRATYRQQILALPEPAAIQEQEG